MKVLVACESSGIVRDAFARRGHDAWSCDILPAEGQHIHGDALNAIQDQRWDLVVAHPPCTYLCSSGLHWNKRRPERAMLTSEAADFFMAFTKLDCAWAIENPVGIMSRWYRKPDQYVQPYEFGDDASKKTGLWLHRLPLLTPTRRVPGRIVDGKERWANQTDSGQNRLAPGPDRWRLRSQTYHGIAEAMADQWTEPLPA